MSQLTFFSMMGFSCFVHAQPADQCLFWMGMELMWLSIVYLQYQERGTYFLPQLLVLLIFALYIITSLTASCFCRISITFRKMDESKIPYKYSPDADLLNIRPLVHRPLMNTPLQQPKKMIIQQESRITQQGSSSPQLEKVDFPPLVALSSKDDFPPLGAFSSGGRKRGNNNGLRHWVFIVFVSYSFALYTFLFLHFN